MWNSLTGQFRILTDCHEIPERENDYGQGSVTGYLKYGPTGIRKQRLGIITAFLYFLSISVLDIIYVVHMS